MKDGCLQMFILLLIALVAVGCGAGFATMFSPISHNTTTYNTTNIELNFLSGNSEVVGVVGLTIVLIMIVRSLRSGGRYD